MKKRVAALVCGVIFGVGLSVSQMVDPQKVLAFLDITGNWDPSLALVMAGALVVTLSLFRRVSSRPAPLLASRFRMPQKTTIDTRLLVGATLFGLGWGMTGYCPGPAVAAIGMGLSSPLIVVGSMIAGFWAHRLLFERNR